MCVCFQKGRAVLALAIAFGVAGRADAEWSLSWLGRLPGDSASVAYAVSAHGEVVVGESVEGDYHDDYQPEAFRWTEAEGIVGLHFLPGHAWSEAHDVSADGSVIVGYSQASIGEDGNGEAFRWTQSGGMVGLDFLPGHSHSWADGVSADGSVVVGYCRQGHDWNTTRAFRWTEGDGMGDLGYPPGGCWSQAVAVSADGSAVVGQWGDGISWRGAFLWTEGGDMVDLGSLPGGGIDYVNDVSADGSTVVGSNNLLGAVRWTEDGGLVALGALSQFPGSGACGVSEDGSLVVGAYYGFPEAFLWDARHGMRDLTELLTAGGVDLDGGLLRLAYDVSSDGQTTVIAGEGISPNGSIEAWVAVIPEPSGLPLLVSTAVAGLVAHVLRRRRHRRLAVESG